MPLIKGKQIGTGADGVATENLNDDVLSADSDGRNKIASNFFNDTTVVADKFSSGSIALDRLEESVIQADGGQAFTADQSLGGFRLTNVGTPSLGTDSTNKAYVDSSVVSGKTWKELVLHSDQLLSGGSGGVLQGILIDVEINPTANDTFIITDGTTTETFTFKASESVAFDVLIGGSAAATLTNLVQAINDDSTLWSAIETSGLDVYFSAVPAVQAVVYRTATSTADDRVYGSLTATAGIQVVEFATGPQNYEANSGTQSDLPAADPAAKRFGLGRVYASLEVAETHKVADDVSEYVWDSDDEAWQQSDIGGLSYESVGNITTVNAGDSASAGSNATTARGDHQHAVATAAAGTISPDDSAAEGASTSLARADHTHGITAAAPSAVGTANSEGSASSFSRSDHIHDSPGFTSSDKVLAPTATSGSNYQTTGETITSTPALNSYVRVLVNGIGYPLGDGDRDDVSGGTNNVACYFSVDSGATARSISAIASGDTLYWNAVHAGFDIETSDEIDFDYLV